MADVIITSLRNKRVKQVRAVVRSRKSRRKHGVFFVEGVHAVTAVYENDWDVSMLIYCPDTVHTDWAKDIIAHADPQTHLPVNEYVQKQLSDRDSPSELMALVKQREDDLARIRIVDDAADATKLLVVLLDRPRSPGNLGSTIRSADALGAQAVIITGHAVDPYDPRAVRASMGSLFEIPVVRVQRHRLLEEWIQEVRARLGHFQVVTASAHTDRLIYNHDLTIPTMLVIGNEKLGLSNYFQALCDVSVTIPMAGSASSLNASVAASIFLYEVNRQRNQ
jgi:TrmH family RNA methyltransferase